MTILFIRKRGGPRCLAQHPSCGAVLQRRVAVIEGSWTKKRRSRYSKAGSFGVLFIESVKHVSEVGVRFWHKKVGIVGLI
jgi:hypothetical protein